MMGFEALVREEDDAAAAKEQCSTTSSSSIGRNSDVSSERSMAEDDSGENEVQSAYNGGLNAMEALEEVLPIRRGISKFYNGKSMSFTSLADAATSPSAKDIVKQENAYTRRRRNLMAFNHVWDHKNHRSYPLRSNGGGISKRSISMSRSSLALAVAVTNNSDSSSSITSEDSASSSSNPSSPLPPLHPLRNRFCFQQSFSLADLQHCAIAATIKMSGSSIGNEAPHQS